MASKSMSSSQKKLVDKAWREGLFLIVIFVVIYILSSTLDLFEILHAIIEDNEELELDEIMVVSSIFSIFLAIFSFRRWFDLKQALREKGSIESELLSSNAELNDKQRKLEQHKISSEKLVNLTNVLQVCKTREEAYKFIKKSSTTIFPESSGAVFVSQDSRNKLNKVLEWGGTQPDSFSHDSCWALRLGKQYTFFAENDQPRCEHLFTEHQETAFCTPLTAHGEVIGVLTLTFQDYENQKAYLPVGVFEQLLSMFAEQISLALANLTLHEKLKNLAIRDPLTGLFNRQYLTEMLEREIYRAHRNHSCLAVLMLDLDHFKKFNDTYGHLAGDQLLKELGTVLTKYFRREDFCCRFGGEEFIILLPDVNKDKLLDIGQTIGKNIQEISILHEGKVLNKVTASMGIALYPENGKNGSELIESADKALYRAKNEGRNRLWFAD